MDMKKILLCIIILLCHISYAQKPNAEFMRNKQLSAANYLAYPEPENIVYSLPPEGYEPFYIGMALFLFIFAGGIGSLLSNSVERRIGAANVFYISMISTLPLMILFVLTYSAHPTISLVIFVITGFITMMATPVTMVMAQNVLPEYKSIISGFINGFSWGIVAVAMSLLGFIAEKFGITNVLIFVAAIPALCSILVKELFKEN